MKKLKTIFVVMSLIIVIGVHIPVIAIAQGVNEIVDNTVSKSTVSQDLVEDEDINVLNSNDSSETINTIIEDTEDEVLDQMTTTETESVKERLLTQASYEPSVKYNSHVQDIGWEEDFCKKNGESSGTTGRNLKVEAVKINLENVLEGAKIKYQVYVQGLGWQEWKENGGIAGTTGKNKKIEAIRIKLEGMPGYTVQYKTHVQDIGWKDWSIDGELSGAIGKGLKIEAVQIKIVSKSKDLRLEYRSHVGEVGWQESVRTGELSGTTGKNLRLEAMNIEIVNLPEGAKIKYLTHVQDLGWEKDWKENGQETGTTGKAKKVEAIRIKLEGLDDYTVIYRAHVQDVGWQNWAEDGEIAGTTGKNKKLEAIEIKIIPKTTEKKYDICIDTPGSSTVYNKQSEIVGWVMTNVKNTKLRILFDNNELSNVTRVSRQDVLDAIKGYGGEENNPKPGYKVSIDYSKYSTGNHTLKVQILSSDNQVLKEISKLITIKAEIKYEEGSYGISGLATKGDNRGSGLTYYKIGDGPDVFFAVFTIHGFEDAFGRDGTELVGIANYFRDKLIQMQDEDLAKKWTIYIIPEANPDGRRYGTTNNGPGRTTLYSVAPNNKGIDLNRCWQIGSSYTRFTDSRNYNGTAGFQANEAVALRNFLLSKRATNGQTVLVDLHGWLTQTIGDSGISSYYSQSFGFNNHTSSYGTGYLVNWARSSLGANGRTARSALIELPAINNINDIGARQYHQKYVDATINMLRGIV